MLRAAHERLQASLGEDREARARRRDPARDDGRGDDRGRRRERLRELNEQLLRTPGRLHRAPEARRASSSAAASRSTRAASTGARRSRSPTRRCSSTASRSGSPGQDSQRGTFAQRHLVLHDVHTGETYTPMQHLDDADGVVRGVQLAALRVRVPRLRVRLLGGGARGARALGGAVRRLRERRADRDRPVHLVGALEVARDVAADAAACRTATRATGPSTRARGSSGSCSSARRRTSASSTARRPRSTSTCSAARRSTRPRAPLVVVTPKGLLRLEGCVLDARRARERRLPSRCSTTSAVDKEAVRRLVLCSGQGLLRPRRPRGARRRRRSRSRASSSSIRSRPQAPRR